MDFADFAEIMFYAEAEGLLPSRAGKLNKTIKDVRADPRPEISLIELKQILNKNGLEFDNLSQKEKEYLINSL